VTARSGHPATRAGGARARCPSLPVCSGRCRHRCRRRAESRMEPGRTEGGAPLEDHRFPCPACGADLRYAPDAILLRCDPCGHEEPIPEARGNIPELDLRAAERSELPSDEMETTRVARCGSCGAEVEFDAAIHAKECPFCASPMVTGTGLNRHIKPQAQLPFLLTEADARAAMQRWLGRR